MVDWPCHSCGRPADAGIATSPPRSLCATCAGILTERARDGMAVLLSTHQLAIVEDLAHRIAILSRGRLIALGTWQELRSRYGGTRLEDVFFQVTE